MSTNTKLVLILGAIIVVSSFNIIIGQAKTNALLTAIYDTQLKTYVNAKGEK